MMSNDRLLRIAQIAYGHCGMCGQDGKDQDLLMEDLEKRIEDAVEAVRDAAAILENAGMDRDKAVLRLVSIMKSEIAGDDAMAGLASTAAEYQGKKVKLNDPVRNPSGSKKKFHVFVKDPKTGKVKKVQFGDPKREIKRDDPERRKSFRARHKCDSEAAKDKTKAKYWSCYQWRKGKKVDS